MLIIGVVNLHVWREGGWAWVWWKAKPKKPVGGWSMHDDDDENFKHNKILGKYIMTPNISVGVGVGVRVRRSPHPILASSTQLGGWDHFQNTHNESW